MKSAVAKTQVEELKNEDLCTVAEAAEILNLSYSTVVKRKGGTKPLTRIRRVLRQRARVFFSRAEVLALKAAKETAIKSELPQPKISAKIPEEEARLEPWDSIVHWKKTEYSRVTGRWGWVVLETCGFCGEKHYARIFDLNPKSGVLNLDCLRSPSYEYKHLPHTGLCRVCLPKINRKNVSLPDGSELFLSRRTKEGLPIKCGACKSDQTLKCSIDTNIHNSHWHCPSCNHIIGSQKHKSGAVIYWMKFKDGNKTSEVAFDCATCGRESYVKKHCVTPKWDGKCEKCEHKRATRAFDEDRLLKVKGANQMVYFSERKKKKIPVDCPVPDCKKKKHIFSIDTIREAENEGRLLVSREHPRSEMTLAFQAHAQNGNGQKNGSAVRNVGRHPTFNSVEEFKTASAKVLDQLDKQGQARSVSKLAKGLGIQNPTVRGWTKKAEFDSAVAFVNAFQSYEDRRPS